MNRQSMQKNPANATLPMATRVCFPLFLALAIALGGCATPDPVTEATPPTRWQDQLARMETATQEKPQDPELRMQFFRAREQMLNRVLLAAAAELDAGRIDAASALYRDVLAVDRNNPRAKDGLAASEARRPGQPAARGDATRAAVAAPTVPAPLDQPVDLDFRDAPLRLVLEALARATGLNVVFDREVKAELKASLLVRAVRAADAIEMILGPSQLAHKMLDAGTLYVYPNTPQKQQENQELVVRSFHIGNADPKQTVNLLRTVLKTRDIFIDERVNMLVMRDTPDAVRIAERLVAMQDVADPEVVLELEILEVSRKKVRELGVNYPGVFSGPPNQIIGAATLANVSRLASNEVEVDRGFAIRLLRTDDETKTLANPRVRVRNKEKAKVHVGERVPIVSSSLVSNNSGAPVKSEQIQYLDVGIKVDAEPTVHPDDTVAVRISLDVSSLGVKTTTPQGSIFYPIETRNVSTALRLKNGETQALMGLIRDNDSKGSSGIPGLSENSWLDRIFGSTASERANRELVLLITPQIVRALNPAEIGGEMRSGTESQVRSRPAPAGPVAAQ